MEEQAFYGNEGFRLRGHLSFTTIHLNGTFGKPQRIVAAFYMVGSEEMEGGTETRFLCQFAFCSPKEKYSNVARGRYIAAQRLLNAGSRGAVSFTVPEEFTGKMVRDALKRLAVEVAKRKNIHWMKEYNESNLI